MNRPLKKIYKNWQFTTTFRTKAVGSIRSIFRLVSSLLTQSLRTESVFLIESRQQKLMSYQAGGILSFLSDLWYRDSKRYVFIDMGGGARVPHVDGGRPG